MKKTLGILAAVVVMTILSAPAQADTIVFVANMTGAQSIPANSSPGTGVATVVLDTVANSVTVSMTFSGLTGVVHTAHIHEGGPTVFNGPIRLALPIIPFSNLPFGANPLLVSALLSGNAYVNLHTVPNFFFPQEEIRGQLIRVNQTPIPEPTTMLLLGTGLAGVAAKVRKRRRARQG